ncbi:RipA family octameric membrane protein [Streptomyces sp. SP18CS02]|uniref:RipA family octameric membrane protein n=1 Tax=Streptomyces sp. SP18CS02 TaxID=3002531 RepID=UPI002E78C190|nr:hypothetical protein [Streptomyces sp. SP18CS02]MEE1753778.1 hypothetical protein [Streptomyces sp. SP18CS02]
MESLWNVQHKPPATSEERETRAIILEQYKICVEMADRVSARRSLANTFFLTLNTTVLTAAGALAALDLSGRPSMLAFPAAVLVVQCLVWFYLVKSYRQLNTAKYRVIGALEERLPASPYWKAEWTELGEGRDRSRYWPLTHVEQWVPLLFAVFYVGGFVILALAP